MTRAKGGIALLVAGLLSGCFFGPTNQDVRESVAAMPGVSFARIPTQETGVLSSVDMPQLNVTMSTATPQQIRAVVDLLKNDPHEDLETVHITVSDSPMINASRRIADIDTDQFVDDAERLRRLGPALDPPARIRWTRDDVPDGALVLYTSEESPEPPIAPTLATIRGALGDVGLVEIIPGKPNLVQDWKIHPPFSADQLQRVNSRLESLPVDISAVTVASGVITDLAVSLRPGQSPETQLGEVVAALGAGPDSPVMLSWGSRNLPRPEDTVHVGGCGYPDPPRVDSLPNEHKTLQQRLREQFDTCPR